MRERPILFQGAMVRAILAGTKTQTRRLVKPADLARDGEAGPELWTGFMGWQPAEAVLGDPGMSTNPQTRCPYGVPGDRLWVRETFAKVDGQTQPWIETDYRATYKHGDRLGDHLGIKKRWTPAIHMPRAASRITLEVTGVRVERLRAISEADAIAEGIEPLPDTGEDAGPNRYSLHIGHGWINAPTAVEVYRMLWEQINGAGSWESNPWVWVVEFKRC